MVVIGIRRLNLNGWQVEINIFFFFLRRRNEREFDIERLKI